MDRDYFTPGAERALAAARRLAGGDGSTAVRPLHIAAALLSEEDGPAIALARRCGFNAKNWLEKQQIQLGTEVVHLEISAERSLRDARSMAREYLVDRTATCDLLFLALCKNDEKLVAEWQAFGFSFVELERIVLKPLQELVPLAEQPELSQLREPAVFRVLDANADRAREALRVLEDYCRFVLNDAILSAALKDLRHELARALPRQSLLTAAGDTENDVGTNNAAADEYRRDSTTGVATANAKRLQESLRSLEEYSKVIDPSAGKSLEQLRYRAYCLEQALHFGWQARERLAAARLYLLVSARPDLEHLIREAVAGGVDLIQLRDKSMADRSFLDVALHVRRWTRDLRTQFIVNDRPDIARICDADGVHLGQDDVPVAMARRVLGPDAIIGVSTHNMDQLRQAVTDGATYVGLGPTFSSKTKNFEELAGTEYLAAAVAETTLPAFALGGVSAANVEAVMAAGVSRIAVSAAIVNSANPRAAAQSLRARLS